VDRPPYRVVARLFAIAEARWPEVDAAYPQVDLVRLRVPRFLNFVYAWAVKNVPPDKLDEWLMILNGPLPGETYEDAPLWSDEEEAAAFASAMSSLRSS
jgi:hypothetical protein